MVFFSFFFFFFFFFFSRKSGYDLDAVTFTTCSDEPIYVHCSYRFWKAEYYTLLFSTTAVPKRTALSDIRPGPLAMSSGLGAVASTLQGSYCFLFFSFIIIIIIIFLSFFFSSSLHLFKGETNEPCVDWQKNCNQFVTTSISDPQPFWPPSGDTWIVSGHFDSPYPPDRLVELGLASMMENRGFFFFFFFFFNLFWLFFFKLTSFFFSHFHQIFEQSQQQSPYL